MIVAGSGYVGVAPGTATMYIPYATSSDLKSPGLAGNDLGLIFENKWHYTGRSWPALGDAGMGFIPSPPQVNRVLSGSEGLGIYPNDCELSRIYQYLPVDAGWTYKRWNGIEGFGNPALAATAFAADAAAGPATPVAPDGTTMQDLVDIQKRQATLQTISTIAISAIALAALVTALVGKK